MLEPCCVCKNMITSFVKKNAFKVKKQVYKKKDSSEVTKEIELKFESLVCPSCVSSMEEKGATFKKKEKLIEMAV